MVLHSEVDDYTRKIYLLPKGIFFTYVWPYHSTLSALHEAYAYARLRNLALGPLRRRSKPPEQVIGQKPSNRRLDPS
jgi:hypothetical protein